MILAEKTYKIEEKTTLTMLYKIINEIANVPNKEILIAELEANKTFAE